MMKHHMYVTVGAIIVGYLFADKLIAYQPWKLTYNAVANL